MRKIYLIYILIIAFNSLTIAQNISEAKIKSTVEKIFELSLNQDYLNAADYFLNIKVDKLRKFDSKNKKEVRAVKRMAKKIKAYLDLSDSYEFASINHGKFKNLNSADIIINFKSGGQELKITFKFVELNNKILLAKFN